MLCNGGVLMCQTSTYKIGKTQHEKHTHTWYKSNQEQTPLQPPKARFKHHKRDDNAKYGTQALEWHAAK
jgi:hypothetical protein